MNIGLIAAIAVLIIALFLIKSFNKRKMTNTQDLKALISNGAFLVDVRTPQEFAEGSAKGAVNIPLDQVANQLHKFKEKSHIVVFCRSGNRSGQAKSILEQNGFANVVNGGTWQDVQRVIVQ